MEIDYRELVSKVEETTDIEVLRGLLLDLMYYNEGVMTGNIKDFKGIEYCIDNDDVKDGLEKMAHFSQKAIFLYFYFL